MNDSTRSRSAAGIGGNVRELPTRKASGRPPWPIVLLAGRQKTGKTTQAADATNSPLVGRGIWLSAGEDDPEEYSPENGYPNLDIVRHDGTYRDLLEKLAIAVEQPMVDGKPNVIILDSGSRLWALLSDMAQEEANRRWARRRNNQGKELPADGVSIGVDLWNLATSRWTNVLDLLRKHQGPSIVTARMENVSVMKNGEPTGEKQDKVVGQKNLAFDVGAVVELHTVHEAYLTGVRSLRMRRKPDETSRFPDFAVDKLWRAMGLADTPAGERVHVSLNAAASVDADEAVAAQRAPLLEEILAAGSQLRPPILGAAIVNRWHQLHGDDIRQTTDLGSLELLRDDLQARVAAQSTDKWATPPAAAGEQSPETELEREAEQRADQAQQDGKAVA